MDRNHTVGFATKRDALPHKIGSEGFTVNNRIYWIGWMLRNIVGYLIPNAEELPDFRIYTRVDKCHTVREMASLIWIYKIQLYQAQVVLEWPLTLRGFSTHRNGVTRDEADMLQKQYATDATSANPKTQGKTELLFIDTPRHKCFPSYGTHRRRRCLY